MKRAQSSREIVSFYVLGFTTISSENPVGTFMVRGRFLYVTTINSRYENQKTRWGE
jgi:hypothetical protein